MSGEGFDSPFAAPKERPPQDGPPASTKEIPLWSWIFFGLCVSVMFATRGGMVPGAIGGGVGGLCLMIAQTSRFSLAMRFMLCIAATVLLWVFVASEFVVSMFML